MTTDTSRVLTAEDVLNADDLVQERIDVPEWGGHFWVRGLTGIQRDDFDASMIETRGRKREVVLKNIRASLVARTACTEDGTRIFTDSQVKALGEKSAAALDRVYDVAARLSGLREEDVEELAGAFSDKLD